MKTIFTHYKRRIGDTITPISSFLNLRDRYANTALFESSDYSSKENSKSFICAEPLVTFSAIGNQITIREGNQLIAHKTEDLTMALEEFRSSYPFDDTKFAGLNGYFGLIGYDAIPKFETVSFKAKTRFEELPEAAFSAYKFIVVFDNFTNQIDILMNSFDADFSEFDAFCTTLFQSKIYRSTFELTGSVTSNETDESFANKVKKSKKYIREGEVFQMVVSRSFNQKYVGDEFEVYRQLRALNPSPYMFYLELDNARLFGASPEAQFRVKDGLAEIHPIAGTMKRTGDLKQDMLLAEELAADKKENAEHTMLVDLARNDLNITCENVQVESYKEIQRFSHVMHMVSKVTGKLSPEKGINAFAKSFPAGTLSGAPKYRAMELIDALEPDNRGYYGGAIGQISANGDLNLAIIIRSCLAYKNELNYQAGAGVVMDSVPQKEVQEVYNKVGAVQKAISLASQIKNN